MTMKEVEQLLEIPRATVRFYEKEGLVSPEWGGNGYRNYTDENGKPYDSLAKCMRNMVIVTGLAGCLVCMMKREWTLHNFLDGFTGILKIMLVEVVLSVSLYFIGKKIPWVHNNRNKVLIGTCVVLILLLSLLANLFGI